MKNKAILIGIIIVVIAFAAYLAIPATSGPGKYDEFAQCLKDKGALFYGAFWCPHCRDQKDLFEGSASKLPYVECSTPDGKGQLSVCEEKEIKSYPTWTFADGEIVASLMTLEQLSTKTGCPLTPGTQTATTTQI
ncbi:MAG: hypothetical protein AAB534_00310 [Patescibacteria group bacterium]